MIQKTGPTVAGSNVGGGSGGLKGRASAVGECVALNQFTWSTGDAFRLHVADDGAEYAVPDTAEWDRRSLAVEVVETGDGFVVERTWTRISRWNHFDQREKRMYSGGGPLLPRGAGWEREPVEGNAFTEIWASWRRRREVGR